MLINLEYLKLLRKNNKGIVLATGTFDLFHYEHLRYLEDAKKLGNILVVAVKDNKAAGLKGINRPIIEEMQRLAIVDALKYVDYTILAKYDDKLEVGIKWDNVKQEQWLKSFDSIFKNLRPDVLYYEDNPVLKTARERVFEHYGIKGISRQRTAIISTSKIIAKINQQS